MFTSRYRGTGALVALLFLVVFSFGVLFAQDKPVAPVTPKVPPVEFRDYKIAMLELQALQQQKQLLEVTYRDLMRQVETKQIETAGAYGAVFKAAGVTQEKFKLDGEKFIPVDPPKPPPSK